jgi:hypothetical protein
LYFTLYLSRKSVNSFICSLYLQIVKDGKIKCSKATSELISNTMRPTFPLSRSDLVFL